MKLSAEQIQENWDIFISNIEKYIIDYNKQSALLDFYNQYKERIILMPASGKKEYHNAFPGGYIDHINRVVKCAGELYYVWKRMGMDTSTFTTDELYFSAINHDIGKMGDKDNEAYIPQTDQWRKEKLGEDYKFNSILEYMSVPDRGIFLLTQHGINITKNEYLAIKLHDGLYDESNKSYLINWLPETKPRTSLIYIIHQADLMASRIEFEREWLPKFNSPQPTNNTEQKTKKDPIKNKALGTLKNENLKNLLDNL
jgi:hypothetical protein